MNERNVSAFRWKRVPPTASLWGSEEAFIRDKHFLCSFRAIGSAETVRAGRDAKNTEIRLFYDPRFISFVNQDRIEVAGEFYDVISVPPKSYSSVESYVDAKAVM